MTDALNATKAAVEEGIVPGGLSCTIYSSHSSNMFPFTSVKM